VQWAFRGFERTLDFAHETLVMGVVNVTPDSFSDGGQHAQIDRAVERARALIEAGADLIDIGGESTRPGATPVDAETERARVVPVIRALAAQARVPISVDTSKASVAAAACDAGARIVNDVTALGDPEMAGVIQQFEAGAVLMHMRGTPETMQTQDLASADIVGEVVAWLDDRIEAAVAAGIPRRALAVDPGIGFGKTQRQNAALVHGVPALMALNRPVLIGLSRKSLVGHLTARPVEDRLSGSLGGAIAAVARGARILRVHDVAETRDALRVAAACFDGPVAFDALTQGEPRA